MEQRPKGIFIHQTKYVSEVLSRFQVEDSKPMDTPIQPNHGIGVDAKGELTDPFTYRAIVGSLMLSLIHI